MAGRATQPYRKGRPRPAGRSLAAMLMGGSPVSGNPQNARRQAVKQLHSRKRRRNRRLFFRGVR